MNKNYRLLSFRSFFIFSFLSFFEGSPSSGFFWGGGERLKILYSRRVIFYIQIFSLFLFLHFFTFYIFYIFRFFHFFTFLQFYNFSEVTLVGVFFLCGEMLKIFLGGCAGLDYFLKKWGVAQTGPTALLLIMSIYPAS